MLQTAKTKILLIGWDAADWKIIHQLVDAGEMPHMAGFIEEGVIGNLATLYPELSPMLWTSIATGKRPFKHGILGFTEPDPHSGGIRPITNISRKTKAIWNILSQTGRKCNVIGWWPSHPVEQINGVMVSNHYQRATAPHGKPWPMKQGSVHPERLIKNLSALRVHPQELDIGLVMNFVPHLAEIDQEKDKRIETLAKIIADCTTINKAATALMHHEPWDFTAVYFDSIDHFCHGFMNYHPPRLSWVDEKDYKTYKQVVQSGYIYHDILLGTLLDKTDENTTVMLISDHGFHSDHLRPRHIPMEPAGPAVQHRPYGIFAVKGPGIKKDEIIYGASLLDVCPTILTLFGLPVGQDMDGKPLINIFSEPPEIAIVPGWDEIAGADGRHPPDRSIDPVEAREALQQLISLGYIEKPDENKEKAIEETVRELHYNLARSYIDAGQYENAVPILKELSGKWPDEYRLGIQLVLCYQATGEKKEARALLEELFRRKEKNAKEAAKKLKEHKEKNKDKESKELSAKEQRGLRKLISQASRNPYSMQYLMGSLLFEEGKKDKALVYLKRAERADSTQPGLYIKLGEVYQKMKRRAEAERNYQKALKIDPECSEAHLGLSQCYLYTKRARKAAESALASLGLKYHNPKGHFLLGIALHRIGRIEHAVDALKVAVSQNPLYTQAYKRLASIAENRLKDRSLAERYRQLAGESKIKIEAFKKGDILTPLEKETAMRTSLTSDQITRSVSHDILSKRPLDINNTAVIVSGLPRSGTSMMMQMLSAGGIPPLTDSVREADEDNTKGYYEFEKAKQLDRDSAWITEAKGKAVKVVAQLLAYLPAIPGVHYRVVFMERDMEEVLSSQKAMLQRQEKKGAKLSDDRLRSIFSHQVKQIKIMLSVRKIPTLFLDYNRTIRNPEATAARLKTFLGDNVDEKKMAKAVDPSLKRQSA
jgi:predicted AlkP superfamily phosphohydrolase/phosphomutase/tetratricopeptide (TPR) repeat protein